MVWCVFPPTRDLVIDMYVIAGLLYRFPPLLVTPHAPLHTDGLAGGCTQAPIERGSRVFFANCLPNGGALSRAVPVGITLSVSFLGPSTGGAASRERQSCRRPVCDRAHCASAVLSERESRGCPWRPNGARNGFEFYHRRLAFPARRS